MELTGVKDIILGRIGAFAILEDGSGYGWGLNRTGQLGIGNKRILYAPRRIGLDHTHSQTFGLLEDGTLYCWGSNQHGQLGIGNTKFHSIPQKMKLENVKRFFCNPAHYMIAFSHLHYLKILYFFQRMITNSRTSYQQLPQLNSLIINIPEYYINNNLISPTPQSISVMHQIESLTQKINALGYTISQPFSVFLSYTLTSRSQNTTNSLTLGTESKIQMLKMHVAF